MRNITHAALLFVVTVSVALVSEDRALSANPGKMIFSNQQIKQGMEKRAPLKSEFTSSETIWARAFFPGRLGALRKGESLNLDIWIDGKFVRRTMVAKPDPAWSQMQIYVRNTGNDDFNRTVFESLDPGTHQVKISVVHDKFMKKKQVLREGRKVWEDVFAPAYLSEGTFTYVVP